MSLPFRLAMLMVLFQSNYFIYGQSLQTKIDSVILSKFQPKGPGGVFLVSKDGKPIYRKGFGKANLELDISMKPENVFEIGSMTKQFTAISILILKEQGKLNLNDEIIKFIPDYPTQEKTITIHHLLTHTSGIKNYTSLKKLRNMAKSDLEPLELIDIFKNEPMDFDPGKKFKYNNSGYVLLGYIIEKVSGQNYGDFVEKHIFQKIGMDNSSYADHKKIIPKRASGYHSRKEYLNASYISYSLPYAAGSLMSTVDDLLIWQNTLNNYELVKKATLDRAFTNYTLNNGETINYGYGWHLRTIENLPSREHGGSIFGFKSMGVYIPSKNIYVIGLSNCDCNSPTKITQEIAALALEQYRK